MRRWCILLMGSVGLLGACLDPEEPPCPSDPLGHVRYWNRVMLDTNAIDQAASFPETTTEAEQLGPTRTSRAFAIVQIAVYDAVVAVYGVYRSYTGIAPAPGASVDAAIAQAAHDTLVSLYPRQAPRLDALLAADLARLHHDAAFADGVALGHRAAAAILADRQNDGSQIPDPIYGVQYIPGNLPGEWRQDPISMNPLALGAYWYKVRPFVLDSSDQFRIPPPPPLASPEYTAAFDEVKRLGGDGKTTPTERTIEETIIGIWWGYDGTPFVGTTPRLFNQITVQLAEQMNALELARILALVNVAMADDTIAAWESKYYYRFWRPVTAIREADPGTGPTGLGDGNPDTQGDPCFTPLGAPATNSISPDFTPPFPAYPSGHAGLAGTVFQLLRAQFGTDAVPFTFVSDEWNGRNRDNDGRVRPWIPWSFDSLSDAEEECGQSRIYLGIHWQFDKTTGQVQGHEVADWVRTHAFGPQ